MIKLHQYPCRPKPKSKTKYMYSCPGICTYTVHCNI